MNDSQASRDEINRREWERPGNWSGGRYSSRLDDRLWVPKRPLTGSGQALNFGHPQAKWFIAAMCIVPAALALVIGMRVFLD